MNYKMDVEKEHMLTEDEAVRESEVQEPEANDVICPTEIRDELIPSRPKPKEATLAHKITKSIMISNIFLFMGLSQSIITPSIDDLRNQVGCNYEEFAHAYVFSSVGSLFGAILGGFLADRFQKHVDLLIGIEVIIGALMRAALPWAPNLIVLATLFAITGLTIGAANPTLNAHLIVIWGAQASSPMQLLHMGYGIGTIVSPLLVKPFLAHPINGSSFNASFSTEDSNSTHTESQIYKPYAAIASYGIFGGCILLLFYFIPSNMSKEQKLRVKEITTTNQMFNPGECSDGRILYGFTMIGLLCALYLLNAGKECSVSLFMYAVAVDRAFSFTPSQGSLLTTGFYAGYAGGRAVYSILGFCVPVQILLFSEVIGMLAVHTSLALLGVDAPLNYIVCICLSGFFAGPMTPSMMTWMDRYIKMTALAFASQSVGLSAGSFLFNWLSGYIFQHKQPVDLYYLSLGCAVAMAILIIIGQILGSIHGDRYKAMEQNKTAHSRMDPSSIEREIYDEQDYEQASFDTEGLIQ